MRAGNFRNGKKANIVSERSFHSVEGRPHVKDEDVMPSLDASRGELRASSGEDWVLISGEALRRVYESEVSVLGTGAFVIWYNAGKTVGKTEGKKFANLADEVGIDQLAAQLAHTYNKLGWGAIKIEEIDLLHNEARISMHNSPMVRNTVDEEPRCWYVRGYIEGMVSTLLAVEATAYELACEAVNGVKCELKVTWKPPEMV